MVMVLIRLGVLAGRRSQSDVVGGGSIWYSSRAFGSNTSALKRVRGALRVLRNLWKSSELSEMKWLLLPAFATSFPRWNTPREGALSDE